MMVIIFNVLYLAEFGLVFLHQSLLVLFQLLHPLCQRINLQQERPTRRHKETAHFELSRVSLFKKN